MRWREGDPVASGHLETDFLAFANTESEARTMVGAMLLNEVKSQLDQLIAARRAALLPWWDAMRDDACLLVLSGYGVSANFPRKKENRDDLRRRR